MKKYITLSLFVIALITGCGSEKSIKEEKQTTIQKSKSGFLGYSNSSGYLEKYPTIYPKNENKKLLAIYMVGSDLETNPSLIAGTTDLNELISGYNLLSNEEKKNLDIVVAFGGADKDGWRGMKIAEIETLLADSKDGVYGNYQSYQYVANRANMGDKSSLTLFLKYIQDRFPNSENKFLTFWDHGSSYGTFGNDENYNGDGLSLSETDEAFNSIGINFDVVGFDTCLNGSMEIAKVMKNYANYLIASEELEPGHGWSWSNVVKFYGKYDDIESYSKKIIDSFVDNNSHPYESDGKTLSLVNLTKMDNLMQSLDDLSESLKNELATNDNVRESVIYASSNVGGYGSSDRVGERTSIDLRYFLSLLNKKVTDYNLKYKIDNLNQALNSYVIYFRDDGTRPTSRGVSIAPPEVISTYDYTQEVEASEGWFNFLRSYQKVQSIDTLSPNIEELNEDIFISSINWDYSDWDIGEWYDETNARSLNSSNKKLPFLSGERGTFTKVDTSKNRALENSVKGTLAKFTDKNLAKVKTIYGNILDGDFLSTAIVEAYKTANDGEYFTPTWNQKWYTIKYDDNKESAWMPMSFKNRYTENGKVYTIYSMEIDYIDSNKDYSSYSVEEGQFDYAKMEITVDENNRVVSHTIRPYKIVYSSENDNVGTILFDKASFKIKVGDKLAFYSKSFDLKTNEEYWNLEVDFIEFTKEPTFNVELLEFEDEKGSYLDYYYVMIAEDIAGNFVITKPMKAEK